MNKIHIVPPADHSLAAPPEWAAAYACEWQNGNFFKGATFDWARVKALPGAVATWFLTAAQVDDFPHTTQSKNVNGELVLTANVDSQHHIIHRKLHGNAANNRVLWGALHNFIRQFNNVGINDIEGNRIDFLDQEFFAVRMKLRAAFPWQLTELLDAVQSVHAENSDHFADAIADAVFADLAPLPDPNESNAIINISDSAFTTPGALKPEVDKLIAHIKSANTPQLRGDITVRQFFDRYYWDRFPNRAPALAITAAKVGDVATAEITQADNLNADNAEIVWYAAAVVDDDSDAVEIGRGAELAIPAAAAGKNIFARAIGYTDAAGDARTADSESILISAESASPAEPSVGGG